MGPALLPTPLLPSRGRLDWRTSQDTLGVRCLTSAPKCSGSRHQRSRRHPASACEQPRLSWTEVPVRLLCSLGGAETINLLCLHSQTADPGKPFSSSIKDQIVGHPMDLLRDLFKRSSAPPAEAFTLLSLKVRVDNHHRVDCLVKFSKTVPCGSLLNLFSALSMIRECVVRPSRARLATPTYPLFLRSLVEGSGKVIRSSQTSSGLHKVSRDIAIIGRVCGFAGQAV